jgi:4-amino-4-deoxy-L-arabinose transferase-like glycosyltransferase
VFAVLCLLVGITYFNSVYNTFVSDDIAGFLNNPYIGNLRVVFSQATFLHYFILYVIYKIFGLQPFAFRMSDILFHLGSTFLLYLLLKDKLKKEWAFIAAALFAVHPLLVESVTWISGGIYVQYSFFIVLGLYLYSKATKDVRYYIPSLLSFLAACFISEKAVVFPLILVVYELCFGSLQKRFTQFLPFAAVGAVWGVWYLFKLQSRIQLQNQQYYQKGVFENPFTRAVTAISSYIQLAFWPDKLTLYHSEITYGRVEFMLRVGVVVLFLIAVVWSYRKNKSIFFWLSLFVISLLPTLLPFKIAYLQSAWIVEEALCRNR